MILEDRLLGLVPIELSPYATIGDFPSQKRNLIGLVLYQGISNTEYFGGADSSTLYRPVLRVIVRHESYEAGKQWVNLIQDTFHKYVDEAGPILGIIMFGNPQYLGRSNLKLHEFQLMFNIMTKE